MEYTHLLLRYGEIFLKGKNRKIFEKRLAKNINSITAHRPKAMRSRMFMEYFEEHEALKRVFGLLSYSPAVLVEKAVEVIKKEVLRFLKNTGGKTFKIETKRSDKSFPIQSPDFNRQVGQYVEKNSPLTFDFSNSDVVLQIEINQEGAFLFSEVVDCVGGLPTGVEGSAGLLVSDENSILAGLLMMKRGVSVFPFGTGDISLLQQYSPDALTLREENVCDVMVVGDLFGSGNSYEGVVLKPLVGYSKKGVREELKKYS